MSDENLEQGLTSRYVIKKALGNYPPWQGFAVTDSLSDRDYLFFSLLPPSGVSFSLDDLKMRDYLFSRQGGIVYATLSLQKNNGGITFLLPSVELIPLTKALPSMQPRKSLEVMRVLVSQVVKRLGSGLFFHNLTPESLVIVNGSLKILPTAYLLPGEILQRLTETGSEQGETVEPIFRDLNKLGTILTIFSRFIAPETSGTCQGLSRRLLALGPP
ncbi:MAG: hypothetical protein KAX38_04010, partial [Candidatus Krumholzibacteria bacterium]|nr:hypothetical protein [Candidatus Krumholzibacteria bacterium]